MSASNQIDLLEVALQIAVRAHAGQKDKSGEPYIFHPIRVMQRCSTPKGKIVALLHDTVEDTGVTFEELVAGRGAHGIRRGQEATGRENTDNCCRTASAHARRVAVAI